MLQREGGGTWRIMIMAEDEEGHWHAERPAIGQDLLRGGTALGEAQDQVCSAAAEWMSGYGQASGG